MMKGWKEFKKGAKVNIYKCLNVVVFLERELDVFVLGFEVSL
jgi:hypothetical protein